MQQREGQFEEELVNIMSRLTAAEGDGERATAELTEMKKLADEASMRPTEAMSNRKVDDVYEELNSMSETVPRSKEDLRNREKAIAALEKEEGFGAKLAEKEDVSLETLTAELSNVKSSEAHTMELLSQSLKRIHEVEAELERSKESGTKVLVSFTAQTKQLEQTKVLLEDAKLEIAALRKRVEGLQGSSGKKFDGDALSSAEELRSLKSEIPLVRENLSLDQDGEKHSGLKDLGVEKEMELLKTELKLAMEAEENSKKAMDDLALALKEIATEANQAKEKLILTREELDHYKKEAEETKEKLKNMEEKHKNLLDEARKEADLHRNIAERLRFEAEESLQAWNGKEIGFVDCIKRAEEEKAAELEENSKLLESLRAAEDMNRTAKQENQKLRDILKQALNEANVSKEAAAIARVENSQLKDILAEKDDALIFITRENESLRINEAAALENIKELKRLLSEASGKDFKAEDKEHDHKQKPQDSVREHREGKKLSSGFSCNLRELIIPYKHKDVDDEFSDDNEDEDSKDADPLKGSIFDAADSPVATVHHRKKSSSTFKFAEEAVNLEDYDHVVDGVNMDDPEDERNSRKKRALLRRVGDILIRRKPVHRRETSIGGDQEHRKEVSVGE